MELTLIQKDVLECISAALIKNQKQISVSADIDSLLSESDYQSVLPLVCSVIPRIDNNYWIRVYYQLVSINTNLLYEHEELHDLLTSNHIPYVVIKGIASSSYYPEPMLRTMGDIDLLVNPNDMYRVGQLLESIGFKLEEDKGSIHVAYHRNGTILELHRDVNGIPTGKAGEKICAYLSDLIENSVDYCEDNKIIHIPSKFHHGLILLIHTASHLLSEGIGLRHLCDWAVFVCSFNSDEFEFLFKDRLKECGLWHFAQLLTLVAIKYIGIPSMHWVGTADDKLLEKIICDIMNSGNFGQKDKDRYCQIKYISNRGKHTVDQKSVVCQLWDTIGAKSRIEHKTRLGVVVSYIGMILSGKRKIDNKNTLKHASERKKIYAELHLFENDV